MGPFNGVYLLVLALTLAVSGTQAERWRWPSGESGAGAGAGARAGAGAGARAEESVRIDTKVRFIDTAATLTPDRDANVQRDEPVFEPAEDTAGFYNRPPGDARYPLHRRAHPPRNEASDGTLDALQYCRCEGSPACSPRSDHDNACGANRYLCCYSRRESNEQSPRESEFFNEVEDERLRRYPGRGDLARPFPPPAYRPPAAALAAPAPAVPGEGGSRPVLVGPQGQTGIIGPIDNNNHGDSGESESAQRGVLIGPGRATGIIGPSYNRPVLVGPGGPTGIIGPRRQGVLVGPGGPTGIIGPRRQSVLVGPGGPTGIIGPRRQGVLVGPGGPTGIIGPAGLNRAYGGPGVLVGPGGPTGTIGPGRQILVGPGGPTGQIGPRGGYGK